MGACSRRIRHVCHAARRRACAPVSTACRRLCSGAQRVMQGAQSAPLSSPASCPTRGMSSILQQVSPEDIHARTSLRGDSSLPAGVQLQRSPPAMPST